MPVRTTSRCALATLVLVRRCVKPNGKERDALRRHISRGTGGADGATDVDVTGQRRDLGTLSDHSVSYARPMVDPTGSMAARSWRIPPGQTAILFLVVAACAALNIYGRPSGPVRVFTILLALATLAWAIIGMRMYMSVDDEGVAVRFVGRESWLPWPDISDIDVVAGVRGAHTIRFTRSDGTHVDVPPSLLQPAKPTKKPVAIARLKTLAADLQLRRSRC